MWAEFKWVVENFGNMLLMVLCLLMLIGLIAETVARLIPTKSPDSLLTRFATKLGRFGKGLEGVGAFVKSVLDFIKFPNNLKK
jgi:hypothetical protein